MCQKQLEPVMSKAKGRDVDGVWPGQEITTHDRDGLLGDEGPYTQQFPD